MTSTPRAINEKYRDRQVATATVTPVSDPCVGDLATPVNSGFFTKALINNLPFYRKGLSPNFRGLEVGAAFGYILFGPFAITGPLRNTDFGQTAGLLAAVGAVHILTALLVLYNNPGKAPIVQPPGPTVNEPPADLFTNRGWADFTSGFWLGGCGGAAFAWFLCGTFHLDALMSVAGGVWSVS
ncbi:MAG: photosystem I reaction center subunit XI [Prochlorococcus sp.]|nr:photosystem I reaction center protein subunit XI [Prochlorococcus sp.]MDP6192766.1 photosystem I reaction center subunit XI [Prochlorococcaceae cyanobacterium ETNP18_MAG_1]CAI8158818.1 MAG: Photosystem I reaction center subunit XI [Prochlorococcus marinus str. MIT 9215]